MSTSRIRGTIARSELRRVLAATYHQVWWPDAPVKYRDGDELPVWHDDTGGYLRARPPARYCRPGMKPWMASARMTCPGTWPGSGTGSTPRA